MNDWASDPSSAYVAITPDDQELEHLFENLAENISKPGATEIQISDRISPCFKIVSLCSPTKGSASLINSTTLQWKISQLGVTASEGATLEFTVQHVGSCSGMIEVNEEILYQDLGRKLGFLPIPRNAGGLRRDCAAGNLSRAHSPYH